MTVLGRGRRRRAACGAGPAGDRAATARRGESRSGSGGGGEYHPDDFGRHASASGPSSSLAAEAAGRSRPVRGAAGGATGAGAVPASVGQRLDTGFGAVSSDRRGRRGLAAVRPSVARRPWPPRLWRSGHRLGRRLTDTPASSAARSAAESDAGPSPTLLVVAHLLIAVLGETDYVVGAAHNHRPQERHQVGLLLAALAKVKRSPNSG